MAVSSIWKDQLYNFPNNDAVKFRIKAAGSVIYTGRAVKKPGETSLKVRINDICADYIANSLPLISALPSLPVSFDIEIEAMGNWNNAGTIQFINDWSYEEEYNPVVSGMSFPILPKVAKGQFLPHTKNSTASVQVKLYSGGGSTDVTMSTPTTETLEAKLTPSFVRALASSGWGGVGLDLSSYTITGIKLGGRTYEAENCVRYVLYYINAYGGMDWFPILGNHKMADSVERNVFALSVNNTNRARARRDAGNTITRSLALHTGWLTDEQSILMHHLLNSTEVYLHDLEEQKVHPVLITSTSHEYGTFKNMGGKPVEYTINVEYANKMKRG